MKTQEFAEVAVGARFKFRGATFLKLEPNLAQAPNGFHTIFQGEAMVEMLPVSKTLQHSASDEG
jgi:hypothetical protein